jgi:hypothetical protein
MIYKSFNAYFHFCHACMLHCFVLYCCVLIENYFAMIDCPDCEPCDRNECVNVNNDQGKCHVINLLLFLMHVFVFSSLHV